MSNILNYINELLLQKNSLVTMLSNKGVTASVSEGFSTLIPKVAEISGESLTNDISKKLYSFGVVSDIHQKGGVDNTNSQAKFLKALNFFENNGVDMVCIPGDVLAISRNYTTYENPHPVEYAQESEKIYIDEMLIYKSIKDQFNGVVYACTGNHDAWAPAHYEHPPIDTSIGMTGMEYVITTTDENYAQYTGKTCREIWESLIGEINFVIEKQNDVFIFFGMRYWNYVDFCRPEDISWLSAQLAAYHDRRVFLFFHLPVPGYFDGPSGSNGMVINPGVTNSRAYEFKQLVTQYPNVIWFNGHSHYALELEADYDNPNTYVDNDGMIQIHCPSLSYLRLPGDPYINVYTGSQGYLIDVYADRVIVKGFDFASEDIRLVPVAQYSIKINA